MHPSAGPPVCAHAPCSDLPESLYTLHTPSVTKAMCCCRAGYAQADEHCLSVASGTVPKLPQPLVRSKTRIIHSLSGTRAQATLSGKDHPWQLSVIHMSWKHMEDFQLTGNCHVRSIQVTQVD